MDKNEIRQIVEIMIEELRECEDGTPATTRDLLIAQGYDIDTLGFSEAMAIHNALFRLAGRNHIKLDMSAHDGLVDGLPYNLDFIVHNKNAGIKCPLCGSANTARYIYGSPAFSKELQKKIDDGKIVLGGCCIVTADVDGQSVWDVPSRKCNDCGKDFGKPALIRSKDGNTAKWFTDEVRTIKFSISAFLVSANFDATIEKAEDGAGVMIRKGMDSIIRHISKRRWNNLLDKLFNGCCLLDWKKNYKPEGYVVLDGESWILEIELADGRRRTWRGNNEYPAYWKGALREFQKFC